MAHENGERGNDTRKADLCTQGADRAIPARLREVSETIRALIGSSMPPSASQLRRSVLALEDAAHAVERLQAEVDALRLQNLSYWQAREEALLELEQVEEQRDQIERDRDAADRRVLELTEHRGMDWAAIARQPAGRS
jgi:hypothetical protein